MILNRPFRDMKVQSRIHEFEFIDEENETSHLSLPLPDKADCNRLLSVRAICFR